MNYKDNGKYVVSMSSSRRIHETKNRAKPVEQQSAEESNGSSNILSSISSKATADISFDRISIVSVFGAFLISSALILRFTLQAVLPITIALVSLVFTFLSVRESKRDREASVRPTLFVGKRERDYGILNLGSGPAHELSVTVNNTNNWNESEAEVENRILRVNGFLALEEVDNPRYVHMEYRSNVGYKEYNVTRKVLSNND